MVHVRSSAIAGLALVLAACAAAPTQVVVRLATDMAVPSELGSIHLEILDGDGTLVREQDVLELDPALNDGTFHELATFGLVPRDDDASRRFEVRAAARVGGRDLFVTRARSGFVREQTIRLDLYLPGLCVDLAATCQPDETCGITGCVDPEIDPADLPSNDAIPPADPVDPRPPVDPPPGDAGFRPLRPLLGERVMTRSPTLDVQRPDDVTGAWIEYCDDPACTTFVEMAGRTARVLLEPGRPVHYWRARGDRAGEIVYSPIYWFVASPLERGVDSTCGMLFDQDGDAAPDVIVGAPGTGATGAAYVLRGSGLAPSTWTATPLAPPTAVTRFGAAIGTGDFDGDGRMEIAVGAPDTAGGGRVVLYDAETPGVPRGELAPSGMPGGAESRFGEAMAGIGDVNRDGFHDLAIVGVNGAGQRVVETYLGSQLTLEPAVVSRAFTSASLTVAGGGDVDGDDYDDLLIGAPTSGIGGEVYRVRGGPDVRMLNLEQLPILPGGPPPGGAYGHSIALGDAAGDGRCDVLVGAPYDMGGGHLFASVDGGNIFEIATTAGMGDELGRSVSLVDLDADGDDDVVATRRAIRTQTLLYVIPGDEIESAFGFTSLEWTMQNGGGTPLLRAIGEVGDPGTGADFVAAELGFAVSLLSGTGQVGDLPIPGGAGETGAALR